MDTYLLKYFIAKNHMSIKSIAKDIGMNVSTLSQKINNKRPISTIEAYRIAKLLRLTKVETWQIFFCFENCENAENEVRDNGRDDEDFG